MNDDSLWWADDEDDLFDTSTTPIPNSNLNDEGTSEIDEYFDMPDLTELSDDSDDERDKGGKLSPPDIEDLFDPMEDDEIPSAKHSCWTTERRQE
jgi:hypothetical protein